jgi:hypothetical protein
VPVGDYCELRGEDIKAHRAEGVVVVNSPENGGTRYDARQPQEGGSQLPDPSDARWAPQGPSSGPRGATSDGRGAGPVSAQAPEALRPWRCGTTPTGRVLVALVADLHVARAALEEAAAPGRVVTLRQRGEASCQANVKD